MKDFTLTSYTKLLKALQEKEYSFFTFEEYCQGKANGKFVILRHDVDLKVENSLAIACIENSFGICATYYFRVVPQSNNPEYIQKIADLGHEVGYHYEDLAITNGNIPEAIEHFKKQLEYFRRYYPVATVCMHGSPASKYDNRNLWKEYDYHHYGIIGEPYFDFLNKENDKKFLYFTDTARMWDGNKYNVRDKRIYEGENLNPVVHSTHDLIDWIKKTHNQCPIMITTHPQRWTDNHFEWLMELSTQRIKNLIKYCYIKIR